MTLTLQLTAEQEERLAADAARLGIDRETYALRRLFDEDNPAAPSGPTMFDRLNALGVIGAIEGKPRKDGRNRSEIEGFPSDLD